MMWFAIVLVLAVAAWFAFRASDTGSDRPSEGSGTLGHGSGGGVPSATEPGEVAGGEPSGASPTPDVDPSMPHAAEATDRTLDAATAARAAHAAENTGGTGAAVLAGIATAAGERSDREAGTATLAVGGATASAGSPVLEDGATPAAQDARLRAETRSAEGAGTGAGAAAVPEGGDDRANVREMMKILNLRESDAGRLGISTDDFARLWQADEATSSGLVDEVTPRLRRMLG